VAEAHCHGARPSAPAVWILFSYRNQFIVSKVTPSLFMLSIHPLPNLSVKRKVAPAQFTNRIQRRDAGSGVALR